MARLRRLRVTDCRAILLNPEQADRQEDGHSDSLISSFNIASSFRSSSSTSKSYARTSSDNDHYTSLPSAAHFSISRENLSKVKTFSNRPQHTNNSGHLDRFSADRSLRPPASAQTTLSDFRRLLGSSLEIFALCTKAFPQKNSEICFPQNAPKPSRRHAEQCNKAMSSFLVLETAASKLFIPTLKRFYV